MVIFYRCILFFHLLWVLSCEAWDLSHIGLSNYSIQHVTIFKNRAYLSIESDKEYFPTLIEVPWPENHHLLLKPIVYPSKSLHYSKQCHILQQVISTDVDAYGRIWILDQGNIANNCSSKLLVINLLTHRTIKVFYFNDNELKLSDVVVDPTLSQGRSMAYVGVSNANIIFVCKLYKHECNQFIVQQKTSNNVTRNIYDFICTENIAISKYDNTLYLTSTTFLSLYKIGLDVMMQDYYDSRSLILIYAEYVGDKLGPSKGLIFDSGYGLSYYLRRDYAVVHWDIQQPLTAEGHMVLAQSFKKLPDVLQLFSDQQRSLWALVNNMRPNENKQHLTNHLKNKNNEKSSSSQSFIKIFDFDFM